MVKKFLLDTGILIDLYRGDPEIAKIFSVIDMAKCEICSTVIAEFFQGVYQGTKGEFEEKWFNDLVSKFEMEVISFDVKTVKRYALIQSKFHKKGMIRPIMDLIIASTCIEYGLELVTKNKKHFEMIPGLKIYQP